MVPEPWILSSYDGNAALHLLLPRLSPCFTKFLCVWHLQRQPGVLVPKERRERGRCLRPHIVCYPRLPTTFLVSSQVMQWNAGQLQHVKPSSGTRSTSVRKRWPSSPSSSSQHSRRAGCNNEQKLFGCCCCSFFHCVGLLKHCCLLGAQLEEENRPGKNNCVM